MIRFTTVVGVDDAHLEELEMVWPTWKVFRPEILEHPLLLICDGSAPQRDWEERLAFLTHPDRRLHCWVMPDASQREIMLSGLVFATASHVTTPWYLKLDTDCAAMAPARWLDDRWFAPDEDGRLPTFVTEPWGYTKPPDAIVRLDAWGDTVPELQRYPRLDLRPQPGASLLRHERIISWCFFGNTAWTRRVASYCQGRLPVPSQDTYLWYCAARQGDLFRTARMAQLGWRHLHRRDALRNACRKALWAWTQGRPDSGPKDLSDRHLLTD